MDSIRNSQEADSMPVSVNSRRSSRKTSVLPCMNAKNFLIGLIRPRNPIGDKSGDSLVITYLSSLRSSNLLLCRLDKYTTRYSHLFVFSVLFAVVFLRVVLFVP